MPDFVPARALGTELRALFEQMDADVGRALGDLGLTGYRPRFSPVVRVLAEGPASVRELAAATGVTHSAASQTVAGPEKLLPTPRVLVREDNPCP